MRETALPEHILIKLEKPARYIGHEVNMVRKNKDEVDIRFAMCFPDVYEIGMSHLGIQIIYEQLNRRIDTYCERVYSPWTDLDTIMRDESIPLFALESQEPVKVFDFLGITLQYEMSYTNVLQIIDLSQIHIWSKERTEDEPFVIGGGPCAYNPEPLADFFDLFYIGEAETVMDKLMDVYKEHKQNKGSRHDFLRKAAEVEGIYVPSLYMVRYNQEGLIESFNPTVPEAPEVVVRQVVSDMGQQLPYPEKPLVPYIQAAQDRVVLEVMRGCIRGCRFCQAGFVYRPTRNRSIDELKRLLKSMLDSTGHDEVSLSSLSSSDYTYLQEIVNHIIDEYKGKYVNISLPSLRIDEFSLEVMSKVQDVRKSSLTFAPEAGSQRLRDVINKGLTEESILSGAGKAFQGGWKKVKLYFMLGLPTETEEDLIDIAVLSDKVAQTFYKIPKEDRQGNGRIEITSSSSFFVPKPFTPFQWVKQDTMEEFLEKAKIVRSAMNQVQNRKSIKYQWHNAGTTILEGVLARGDRRLSKVLYAVYRMGSMFDAWTEHFKLENWQRAFSESGIDMDFYTTRERSQDEILPWDFIDIGVSKDYLYREYENAIKGKVTPNCRQSCSGCGAAVFQGGVCYESQN